MTKICLITDSLSLGGAERMAANLSVLLKANGFDVSLIALRDDIDYEFDGKLYNIGKYLSRFKWIKQIQKFYRFKNAYQKVNADCYIDFRIRGRWLMEYMLHQFIFDEKKMIMTVHNYNIFLHLPKFNYFYKRYDNCKAVISVSEAICERLAKLYSFRNLKCIYNFYDVPKKMSIGKIESFKEFDSFVVAIGRLNNKIKQFDKLIEAYNQSILPSNRVGLLIFGKGNSKTDLQQLINESELTNYVKLMGFSNSIKSYIKASQFLVLSSLNEGLPMVLIEALALETPVVSFDCKSGPSEIIISGKNGILVEDQNFEALTHAMNKMINDKDFYKTCKNNAKTSVEKFSSFEVIKSWENLINKS